MSIETDATGTETGDDVDALARELGDQITDLPVYERYQEAKAKVEADEKLQEEIREFEQIREEFMLARQTGEATQEDVQKVQEAQQELHSLPVMDEYLQAQEKLEEKMETINETISEPLAVDFGDQSSGCCED